MAYKQAKISNKCAECCCPSFAHVSKGTLFTIFLLVDISDDNKHLAFEVTTKVAFTTSIICTAADFQNGLISSNIWCFLERLFAQNYSNVVVESISACSLE